jgi:hypothetical protein
MPSATLIRHAAHTTEVKMSNTIDAIVQAFLLAQKAMTAMHAEDRIAVGEKLALAIRQTGALNRFTFCDTSQSQHVEVDAGILRLWIAAEADPYGDIPF